MTKILIIEDELPVKENLTELLEAEDFEVFSTDNGILGILWAQENLPDLIICDVMMPQINGHEVLDELRQWPITASIPFIFLTAMADKNDIRKGMELGADDYLTKPFTREEVLGAIAARLQRQQSVVEQYQIEHQKAEALQKQVEQLQQHIAHLETSQAQFDKALMKVHTAVSILKKQKPGPLYNRGLSMIKETCSEEIKLIKQIPNIQDLLEPENANMLSQLI